MENRNRRQKSFSQSVKPKPRPSVNTPRNGKAPPIILASQAVETSTKTILEVKREEQKSALSALKFNKRKNADLQATGLSVGEPGEAPHKPTLKRLKTGLDPTTPIVTLAEKPGEMPESEVGRSVKGTAEGLAAELEKGLSDISLAVEIVVTQPSQSRQKKPRKSTTKPKPEPGVTKSLAAKKLTKAAKKAARKLKAVEPKPIEPSTGSAIEEKQPEQKSTLSTLTFKKENEGLAAVSPLIEEPRYHSEAIGWNQPLNEVLVDPRITIIGTTVEMPAAAPLAEGQTDVLKSGGDIQMVGEAQGPGEHPTDIEMNILDTSRVAEEPNGADEIGEPLPPHQNKSRKSAKKTKPDAGKAEKEKEPKVPKTRKTTKATKVTKTTRVITSGTNQERNQPASGEPRWTLTNTQSSVFDTSESSNCGERLVSKPKIWCGSKEELLSAQPELAKCTNSITWSLSATPVIFIDKQSSGIVVSDLAADGLSFQFKMSRNFVCLSADLALPTNQYANDPPLRLRGGASLPSDDDEFLSNPYNITRYPGEDPVHNVAGPSSKHNLQHPPPNYIPVFSELLAQPIYPHVPDTTYCAPYPCAPENSIDKSKHDQRSNAATFSGDSYAMPQPRTLYNNAHDEPFYLPLPVMDRNANKSIYNDQSMEMSGQYIYQSSSMSIPEVEGMQREAPTQTLPDIRTTLTPQPWVNNATFPAPSFAVSPFNRLYDTTRIAQPQTTNGNSSDSNHVPQHPTLPIHWETKYRTDDILFYPDPTLVNYLSPSRGDQCPKTSAFPTPKHATDLKPDQYIPPKLPPEIEAICNSYVAGTPVVCIASCPFLEKRWGFSMPAEYSMTYLGFFKITSVQEYRISLPEAPQTPDTDCITGRVEWCFTCIWIPDGTDAAFYITSGHYPRPWWASSSPSISPDSKPSLAPPVEDPSHTSPRYLLRRQEHPNYSLRELPLHMCFEKLLPNFLLAPAASGCTDDNIPTGWFCSQCGRINFQNYLRHRKCRSSFCKKGKVSQKHPQSVVADKGDEGYAVSLDQIRDPQQASPLSHPINVYPLDVVEGVGTVWEDGMQTFMYTWRAPSSLGKEWQDTSLTHVFTGNTEGLQHDAGLLLRELQLWVPLQRKMGGISPNYTYVAGTDESGLAVPWTEVSPCVHHAKDVIISRTSIYAEKDITINCLSIYAWTTSGTRKASEPLVGTNFPVVLMVLGCEVSITFVPKSGFHDREVGEVLSNESLRKIDWEGDVIMSDDNQPADPVDPVLPKVEELVAPQSTSIVLDANTDPGTIPDGSAADVINIGPLVSEIPVKGNKRSVVVTLVHGDVAVLSGDVFEYSSKRFGTSILLVGSTTGPQEIS